MNIISSMTKEEAIKIRKSFKFSQSEWGKFIKVNVRTIQGYELGREIPDSYAQLVSLVDACRNGGKKGSSMVLADWAFD